MSSLSRLGLQTDTRETVDTRENWTWSNVWVRWTNQLLLITISSSECKKKNKVFRRVKMFQPHWSRKAKSKCIGWRTGCSRLARTGNMLWGRGSFVMPSFWLIYLLIIASAVYVRARVWPNSDNGQPHSVTADVIQNSHNLRLLTDFTRPLDSTVPSTTGGRYFAILSAVLI